MSTHGKVLYVDDDEDLCDVVCETLEDAGYGVSIARNGAIAMSALKAASDLPCLILLDLMMPVMDGEHFLQEMRKDPRLSAVPVVLLTADGHATTKAVTLGVHGGLGKPVQLGDLLSTLSKYCQHH